MLIGNGDGTFTGGPLDVICLLLDVRTGRYHACFAREAPPPGPVKPSDEVEVVRLKSEMHHTAGGATEAEGLAHLEDLAKQIHLHPENIQRKPILWDGEVFVILVPNWRRGTPHTVEIPDFVRPAQAAQA